MFSIFSSALLVLACSILAGAATLPIPARDLTVEGDLGTFQASWQVAEIEPHLVEATLTLLAPAAATLKPLTVQWRIPAINISGLWVSDYSKAKHDHLSVSVSSRAARGVPVINYFDSGDQNRITIALSDALNPCQLSAFLKEEDAQLHMTLSLFEEEQPAQESYQITIRFDARPIPYYQALRETTRWWAGKKGYEPATIPESARVPVYSTWYSYHQNLDPDEIVEECRLGGELGLHGVIVDDGWQTLDGSRGYAFTGDWRPERIPEMATFVERVHDLKQEFLLWYSVPMVGEQSEALKQFEGKTLRHIPGFKAYVLDPRYPEVRDYLIEIYESAVRDWDLDGLKLDFIAVFVGRTAAELTARDGRDYASVDQAVDRLMTDVMARLKALKPDIAIEFRQPYNGPLMRKYGNMLRAIDCPNGGPVNRNAVVDLRLIVDSTAVHSDMILWHPDEPAESAALQILNIIFGVPQISVRLADLSPRHREMLRFWMGYWMENRATLLDGEFQPSAPGQNYPLVIARTKGKLIAAVYQDLFVSPGKEAPPEIHLLNAKASESLVLNLADDFGLALVEIYDTTGRRISAKRERLAAGPHAWQVPPSGLVTIKSNKEQ